MPRSAQAPVAIDREHGPTEVDQYPDVAHDITQTFRACRVASFQPLEIMVIAFVLHILGIALVMHDKASVGATLAQSEASSYTL